MYQAPDLGLLQHGPSIEQEVGMWKSSMRRVCLAVAACAALVSCGGGDGGLGDSQPEPAVTIARAQLLAADATLDAAHWPATAPYGYLSTYVNDPLNPPSILQPVKAIASGRLARVSLNLCVSGTSGSTVLQVRRTAAFLAPVIATAQVSRANSPLWGSPQCPGAGDLAGSAQAEVTFDLSGANVDLTAGEEYSIALANAVPASAGDNWFGDFNGSRDATPDNWLVLMTYQGSQTDLFGYRMRFKTYVVPAAAWAFSGFLPPVKAWPAIDRVQAGAALPVKFSFGADKGLDIFSAAPSSVATDCNATAASVPDGDSASSPGQSALRYDPRTAQYTYVWQTDASWAQSCRDLVLRFKDGSSQRARFQFR
jgi:hypothetical protein